LCFIDDSNDHANKVPHFEINYKKMSYNQNDEQCSSNKTFITLDSYQG